MRTWLSKEFVEFIERPFAALAFHGGRIGEPWMGGSWAINHPPEIRADLVWDILFQGMTGHADLGFSLAAIGIRLGKSCPDRSTVSVFEAVAFAGG
jgi:hypothetical protein